jgi:hypothetical protein
MTGHIDHFCGLLRQKLVLTESDLFRLRAKIKVNAANVDRNVQVQLKNVKIRIGRERATVRAAEDNIKRWADAQRRISSGHIAECRDNQEFDKLRDRAELAEEYAAAAIDMAVAAMDLAELASLEAWLARQDSDCRQNRKAVVH